MRRLLQFGLIVAIASPCVHAAEFANLRNGFSIRHERHEIVGDQTRLYMGDEQESGFIDVPTVEVAGFEIAPELPKTQAPKIVAPARPLDLAAIIAQVSKRSQMDADFIESVIRAESASNPRAVSPKGARGLMQLMPDTAAHLGVTNSFDAAQNVDGGVRYLLELLALYNYDVAKALAAYNAGPRRVQQYHGVPPYRETRAYVARIIRDYNRKKLAERKRAQLAKALSPSAGGAQ